MPRIKQVHVIPQAQTQTQTQAQMPSQPHVSAPREVGGSNLGQANCPSAGPVKTDVYRSQLTPDEGERCRLISDISRIIRQPETPDCTRAAALTLIGWLARRQPGERAHGLGVEEARADSERRLRSQPENAPSSQTGTSPRPARKRVRS